MGKRRHARVGGSDGPGQPRTENDRGADGIDVGALPDEQRDPEQTGRDPRECAQREPDAEEGAVEDGREQRHGRNEERREARGDTLLGPRDPAGIDEQEQAADERRGRPLAPARPCGGHVAAPRGPAEEEPAGEREADREHQQRGQRPVGDGDREIRRSPDDVDDSERDGDLRPHGSMVPGDIDQGKLSYRSFRS